MGEEKGERLIALGIAQRPEEKAGAQTLSKERVAALSPSCAAARARVSLLLCRQFPLQ